MPASPATTMKAARPAGFEHGGAQRGDLVAPTDNTARRRCAAASPAPRREAYLSTSHRDGSRIPMPMPNQFHGRRTTSASMFFYMARILVTEDRRGRPRRHARRRPRRRLPARAQRRRPLARNRHRRRARHPVGDEGHRRRPGAADGSSSSGGPASASTTSTLPPPPRRGVMVVNAPQSNILSAAEHTMALLLAQARNVPQAHAALQGRQVGALAVGGRRAARQDARRHRSRPHRCARRAARAGVRHAPGRVRSVRRRRARPADGRRARLSSRTWSRAADFVTIHLPKTPETIGLIGAELLEAAKPSLRIINTARGGIVDEAALAEADPRRPRAGRGARRVRRRADDASPLFELDSVVVTPHLGASTREAQDKAGDTIAEQVLLALAGDFVPFAVNVDAAEASETVRPFLPLGRAPRRALRRAERGRCAGTLEVEYHGAARRLRHAHPHALGAQGGARLG